MIAVLGRMADNMATEHKSTKGALTHRFSKALLDVSEMPLFHKPIKRKNHDTTPNQPKKAKPTLDNTPKEVTVWGPGGVANTLNMARTVIDNFGLYSMNADYVVGSFDSPTREIEIRVKRILQLSKNDLVQQAKLVLEYKRLAETFRTLEYETRDRTTSLGRLWDAREHSSKLKVTEQARANFVMNHVVCSMNPEEMTSEKKKEEMRKFRRKESLLSTCPVCQALRLGYRSSYGTRAMETTVSSN